MSSGLREVLVAAVVVGLFAALSVGGWYLDRRATRRAVIRAAEAELARAYLAVLTEVGQAMLPAFRAVAEASVAATQAINALVAVMRAGGNDE